MKKLVAVVGLVLALVACSTKAPPPPQSASEGRALLPKIAFDVKRITLADRSGLQPANSPYNQYAFSPTIAQAIKQWAVDRLQAVGQSGQAIILIKRASLASEPLPMESGVDSWFTRQQATKYTARAEVSIKANGQVGFAVAEASAIRSVSLPEEPTSFERDEAYYNLLNALMADLGRNLEASIHAHMGNFIVTPPIFGSTAVPLRSSAAQTTVSSSRMIGGQPVPQAQPVAEQPKPVQDQTSQPMPRDPATVGEGAPLELISADE